MTKIAINQEYGGFGLSDDAYVHYAALKGITLYPEKDKTFSSFTNWYTVPPEERQQELEGFWLDHSEDVRRAHNERAREEKLYDKDIPRDDPHLIQTIEEMGSKAASGRYASLKIVEIPDDVKWQIEEYDGREWVAEQHRTW